MMPREVLREPTAHLIGSPRVVIDREDSKATVWISGAPWGWGSCEREFLNPASPSIDRYAQQLLDRIRVSASREADRKERNRQAQRREAEGGGE